MRGPVGFVTLVSRPAGPGVQQGMTTKLVDCPECGSPATSRSQGRAAGTDGPIEYVHLRCVVGHRFFGPVDILVPAPAPQPVAPGHAREAGGISWGAAGGPGRRPGDRRAS
ncbi:hypothetical protein GCM10007977_005590 [Dactylosporangium sucinum]|uniref:Uncharacterized protein n=1 Tax=Dactylosporangium sucinum TaxID=1424081 RepID=A0A917T2Y8_9ACTN|nr:hypothetical protein GCM10007977_005590 [Dactylosporangium sucinum]